MKRYLNASEVAELAELLEDYPVRAGTVDQVLQAGEERRGMTLVLRTAPEADPAIQRGARRKT